MTKTLTDKWREGKLPAGLYYIEGKGNYCIGLIRNIFNPVLTNPYCKDDVFEPDFVPVDTVPSYYEYIELVTKCSQFGQFCELILAGEKQEWENIVKRGNRKEMTKWLNERKNKTVDGLQKKLEIATKALEYYTLEDAYVSCYGNPVNPNPMVARKALKEMKTLDINTLLKKEEQ